MIELAIAAEKSDVFAVQIAQAAVYHDARDALFAGEAQHDLSGQRAVASAASIYHDHISLLRHVDRLMEKEIVADRRFHRGGRSVPLPVRQSPDSSFHLQCLNDLFPCLNAHLTHRLVN